MVEDKEISWEHNKVRGRVIGYNLIASQSSFFRVLGCRRSQIRAVLLLYNRNEVSLHCTQTTKVAVFNGIRTSKERRGPLSMLNIGGSDGRASASVSCDRCFMS
jgi:hypothetical protein